jgi:hypothetical protein
MLLSFFLVGSVTAIVMHYVLPQSLLGFLIFFGFLFINLMLFNLMFRPLLKQSLRWSSVGFIALLSVKICLWAALAVVLVKRPDFVDPLGVVSAVICLVMTGLYLALRERQYESRT